MQLMADLLGVRVAPSGLEEVSALSAAYMTALGSGAIEGLADLTALPRDQIAFEASKSARLIRED